MTIKEIQRIIFLIHLQRNSKKGDEIDARIYNYSSTTKRIERSNS